MTTGKALPEHGNETVRAHLRDLLAAKEGNEKKRQAALAKELGVSQGFLSEVLSGKRGAGTKLLAGIASLRPDLAASLLALRGGRARAKVLERLPEVPLAVAEMARSVLRKRGWSDPEIDAAAGRVRFVTQRDAGDALTVADAWEAPLLGRAPKARPASRAPAT